jgi:diguanylate cyclase (GGDEF)-like protein
LIVVLGLGASLLSSLGLLLRLEEHEARYEATRRTAALLSALSAPTSMLYTQGRAADLDALFGELDARKEALGITAIVLVDGRGSVLAEAGGGVSYGESLASDPFVAAAIATSEALADPPLPARPERVAVPVQSGVRWATLVATLDNEAILGRLSERRTRLVTSAIAVSMLGLIALLLLLSREVLAPVREVVRAARRLAAGDFGVRADVLGAQEVKVLASTINEAAQKLGHQREALEAEVARRTEELLKANAALAEANERLEKMAITDPLTGLPNRRYLEQTLALEVVRQKRNGMPFSLVMLDVDHFKHYNDTHGHPKGDELLRSLARVVQGSLRASDVVARVGGEEFTIVLLDTEVPAARAAAEKVREAVAQTDFEGGATQPLGRITVSLGVASWPRHGVDPEEVIAAADRALYRSKGHGRNVTTTADEAGP